MPIVRICCPHCAAYIVLSTFRSSSRTSRFFHLMKGTVTHDDCLKARGNGTTRLRKPPSCQNNTRCYFATFGTLVPFSGCPWGRLKRSARTVQLFGCLAAVETHTLWYFGHHCYLVVGFDALEIWHFWMFTLFHPFLPFCTHFFPFPPHLLFFSVD